jgi:hypothetical protein
VGIEVGLVLVQHCSGMTGVQDKDSVEEFAADAPHDPFTDRVRARRPRRDLQDVCSCSGEHGIERASVLGVPVADQEPHPPTGILQVHQQVAHLLGNPRPGRLGGDAEDPDPAGGVLDGEEDVEPAQGDRVQVEEVAGHDSFGLGFEEFLPGGARPPRRGIHACGLQDVPHGRGAEGVAEPSEFAVDAPVSCGCRKLVAAR